MLGSLIPSKSFGNVDSVVLCQTMDLVAVLSGSALTVFRLNWQKVFSVSVAEKSVLSVVWSPKCNFLCVLTSAEISFFLSETGECVRRQKAEFSPASFLSWARLEDGEKEAALDLALLTCRDAVQLFAGSFLLSQLSVGPFRAWLSSDLGHLVLVKYENETVTVLTQALPRLLSAKKGLSLLMTLDHALRRGTGAIVSRLERLLHDWKGARVALDACLGQLKKRLEETGSTEQVSDVLIDILLCGPRINGTLMWLESDLGDKGSTKLLKTLLDATQNVTKEVESIRGLAVELKEQATSFRSKFHDATLKCVFHANWVPFLGAEEQISTLIALVTPSSGKSLSEMQRPSVMFCQWLLRYHKLQQLEEVIKDPDETRRKELETWLQSQRKKGDMDERVVAAFMKDPSFDSSTYHLEKLIASAQAVDYALDQQMRMIVPLMGEPLVTIVSMPAPELKDAVFASWKEGNASLVIHRSDDLAFVSWDDLVRQPKQHNLSVYDAMEGDIVSVDHYKDGSLLVLSSDAEAGNSLLTHVSSSGDDLKSRRFDACAKKLSVSKDRGLAAVELGNGEIALVDVENEEDEEEQQE